MENETKNLSERLLDFGVRIIKLTTKLNKTGVGRHIGDQLMRSATSLEQIMKKLAVPKAGLISSIKCKLS